jgi:large subunit ribosomal protein L5
MAVPRLKEKYQNEVVPALRQEFGYKNVMEVPKVTKVTLNMGIGEGTNDAKALEEAGTQLGQITGQKAQLRRARKRIRDFRGVAPGGFDGRGNFNLGVKEQIIFPEIDYDKIDRIRGLDIAITTTAKTDDEGRALLKLMGMPFRES